MLETYHDGKQLNEKYYLKTETILNRLKWNAETTTNHKFEYTEGGHSEDNPGGRDEERRQLHQGKITRLGRLYPKSQISGIVIGTDGISPTMMLNHGSIITIADDNG